MPTKPAQESFDVLRIDEAEIVCHIVGTSPLILNAMPAKAWHELFMPTGRKTAAERQSRLKHEPYAEFRESAYTFRNDDAPTLIATTGACFKQSIMTAALDQPGMRKAQIGRLVRVPADRIPVFGEPQIFSSIVRSADINHTPDVRTRCIIPHWACEVRLFHATPLIKSQPVINLLAAAGVTSGIGDWRTEKGSGSYGGFRLVGADDEEYAAITKAWGRKAQQAAFENPVSYDSETDELLTWFSPEAKRRGFSVVGQEKVG